MRVVIAYTYLYNMYIILYYIRPGKIGRYIRSVPDPRVHIRVYIMSIVRVYTSVRTTTTVI